MTSSNRTITGKFTAQIRDNRINIELRVNLSDLTIYVDSEFPIASPITIQYSARGSYNYCVDFDADRWATDYFEDMVRTFTLKAGESLWELNFTPLKDPYVSEPLPNSAKLINADAYIDFTEFSDQQFNYKKGETNASGE